jgi:hypothetical protein
MLLFNLLCKRREIKGHKRWNRRELEEYQARAPDEEKVRIQHRGRPAGAGFGLGIGAIDGAGHGAAPALYLTEAAIPAVARRLTTARSSDQRPQSAVAAPAACWRPPGCSVRRSALVALFMALYFRGRDKSRRRNFSFGAQHAPAVAGCTPLPGGAHAGKVEHRALKALTQHSGLFKQKNFGRVCLDSNT